MLIAKSESLHGSLIYGPPLSSPPLPLSRCYYDFSFLSKIVHLFVMKRVLAFRGLGSGGGLVAGPSPRLPESSFGRASSQWRRGPCLFPIQCQATLRGAGTLCSVHLLSLAWAAETPGAASGPALPDRVPPNATGLSGLMRRAHAEGVRYEVRDPRLVKRRLRGCREGPSSDRGSGPGAPVSGPRAGRELPS